MRAARCILVSLLVVGVVPGTSAAEQSAVWAEAQCMPWNVPQNVRDGEGASNWDLYQRPVGTVRGAVIFVDFPDAPATETTQAVFDQVAAPAVPFYESASHGALDLSLTPRHEWLRMSRPSSEYELDRDDDRTFAEYMAYVQEAVELADAGYDFSGTDLLYVVSSADADANFSPQQSVYAGAGVTADGKRDPPVRDDRNRHAHSRFRRVRAGSRDRAHVLAPGFVWVRVRG